MKRVFFRFILAIFAAALWVGPLWADTDYVCLNGCTKGGKPASGCLSQCTQYQPSDPKLQPKTAIDYRCMELCTNNGKSAVECKSTCTYNVVQTPLSVGTVPPPPNGSAISSHEILHAPVPIGDTVVPSIDKAIKPSADKNYRCIAQCRRDGMQDQLCNQKCELVTPDAQSPTP